MIKYAITDPKLYGSTEDEFRESINKVNGFDFILYRDKQSLNYIKFAKIFSDVLKRRGIDKFLIHQKPFLAKELGAFGVHLSSDQIGEIEISKKLNLFTVVSCHSFKDIQLSEGFGADAVTFSPIFETPNKGKPKGLEELQEAINRFPKIKIFALGGIKSQNEFNQLLKVDRLFGFSSIRFFK